MHAWRTIWRLVAVTLLAIVSVNAQTITVGSSRQEVIAQFGEPLGTIKSGAEEVLSYHNVEVTLQNGRVTKLIRLNDRPLPTAPASTVTGQPSQTSRTNDAIGATPTNVAPAITPAATNQVAAASTKETPAKHLSTPSKINGITLLVLGAVLTIWGGVWLLIKAYRASIGWLLACLFLPFAQVVFACMHWDEAGKPFLISVAGGVALGIGIYVLQP